MAARHEIPFTREDLLDFLKPGLLLQAQGLDIRLAFNQPFFDLVKRVAQEQPQVFADQWVGPPEKFGPGRTIFGMPTTEQDLGDRPAVAYTLGGQPLARAHVLAP